MRKLILVLMLINCTGLYADTIYKTVDANGHTTFSQTANAASVPIEINNTSNHNIPVKQKKTTPNKKFNTLSQLQKKLNNYYKKGLR